MKIIKWGFRLETYPSKCKRFTFINSRLMNARQFYFLTTNKTYLIIIPMPSLFYQKWNREKGWTENIPTKYNLFWVKLKAFNKKLGL